MIIAKKKKKALQCPVPTQNRPKSISPIPTPRMMLKKK